MNDLGLARDLVTRKASSSWNISVIKPSAKRPRLTSPGSLSGSPEPIYVFGLPITYPEFHDELTRTKPNSGSTPTTTAAAESIATLRSVLPTKQDLFDDLILNKARLRDLLNGRSLNGNSLAVNADFPQQAIFLTQQLKCSKKYITSILDAVVAIDPSVGVVNSIEAIVAEFHQ
ncbi:hypothetical protein EV363DRAFT_1403166 [Boletus edulis]|nr:hypothetical protein EV363DRAFT_1403166 [Boletus edulis]